MMLFEDTVTNSPYELLEAVYGNKLKGSGGNRGLAAYVRDIVEPTLVYIDVMPDKIETIEAYYSLLDAINGRPNFAVIPIPCIEYYTIKSFMKRDLSYIKCAIEFGDYRVNSYMSDRRKYLSTTDFENYCKSIVLNYSSCFKNGGKFYSEDCLCDIGKFKCSAVLSVENKSMAFIASLPVYEINGKITFDSEKVTSININKTCVNRYNDIARKYYNIGLVSELNLIKTVEEYNGT